MVKRFLNIDQQELARHYKSGMSLHQLASMYNTSRTTIRKRLCKLGVHIRSSQEIIQSNPDLHRHNSLPKFTYSEEEIIKLSKTHTISQIANKTRNNPNTIKRILSKHSKKPKQYNFSQGMKEIAEPSRQNWDQKDILYDLYITQQLSCGEIAEKFGYHRETIRTKVLNYGIKLRPLDEANTLAANTTKGKATRSKISKKAWKKPGFRENIISKLTGTHPKMPLEHAKNVSQAIRKLYTDPTFREAHKKRVKKLWQTPTPQMLNHLYQLHQDLREDTPTRARLLRVIQSDERRELLSCHAYKQWSDVIFLKYKLPIIRRKCSEASIRLWKNPEFRHKILTSISERSTSRLEIILASILEELNIKYRKIRLGGFEFDFVIEKEELNQDKGLLIEVNGLYIHTRPKQIKRDAERMSFWRKELSDKYRFETIWEYDFGAYKKLYESLIKILDIKVTSQNIPLKEIKIQQLNGQLAELFYNKYHYLTKHRLGYHIGAYYKDQLIACCTMAGLTRLETATRQGLDYTQIRQLSRFCINPCWHNKNLASYFLSRAMRFFADARPQIRMLVTFADQTAGHIGTIYKATNWKFDGMTTPSYFYEKQGFRWHKKTIWDYAKSMGMTETEFTTLFDITKIPTLPKYRYIYELT